MLLAYVALAPEHRDVITTGGQVVIALLVYLGARLEFQARQTRKARAAAEAAAERTRATGNGYAARTEEALNLIRQQLVRMEARLDAHIDRRDP